MAHHTLNQLHFPTNMLYEGSYCLITSIIRLLLGRERHESARPPRPPRVVFGASSSRIPGVLGNGMTLSSDAILEIVSDLNRHDNLVRIVLACGDPGKLSRVRRDVCRAGNDRNVFVASSGPAENMVSSMFAGVRNTISEMASLAPRACVRVRRLFASRRVEETRETQGMLEVVQNWLESTFWAARNERGDADFSPGRARGCCFVIDTPNKISIANIPSYLTEDQVMELATSFGKLNVFILVKDNSTDEPGGCSWPVLFAFQED